MSVAGATTAKPGRDAKPAKADTHLAERERRLGNARLAARVRACAPSVRVYALWAASAELGDRAANAQPGSLLYLIVCASDFTENRCALFGPTF